MTSRFVMPLADVGSGIKPPDGAKLYFFDLDGVTPKDTYTTKSANVSNTNPVIAGPSGVFDDIYITGDYLVTLTDKSDVQIPDFGLLPVNEFLSVTDDLFVRKFDTVANMVAAKDLKENDIVLVKERDFATGVITSSESPNTFDIIDLDSSILQWTLPVLDGTVKLSQIGVVLDYNTIAQTGTDNTEVIKRAIEIANTIEMPPGNILFTETITLNSKTKFVGKGIKGTFASFETNFRFKPSTLPAETTLNGAILSTDTSVTLTDASGFPTSGRAQIGEINFCEYITWSGKSANTLTGVARDAKGGTELATGFSDLTVISVMINAFERLSSTFTGSFINIAVYHEDFVDSPRAYGRGNGLFIDVASFATLTDNALFFGFERCIYGGDAFVTSLHYPMTYKSRSGIQLDIGNGATIYGGDQGQIGESTAGVGIALLAKNGSGLSVFGGNWGNGSNNVPFKSNGCKALNLHGVYTEAAKQSPFQCVNSGRINAYGPFVKSGFQIGVTSTNGEIHIDGMISDNIDFISGFTIFPSDGTGSATIKNWRDFDLGEQEDFYMLNGLVVREQTLISNPTELKLKPRLKIKSLTDSVATAIMNVSTTVSGSSLSKGDGFTINYVATTEFNDGQTVEKGVIQVSLVHRITIDTVATLTKDATAPQSSVVNGSLIVSVGISAFTGSNASTQAFDIEITPTTNAGQDTEFKYWLDNTVNDGVLITFI